MTVASGQTHPKAIAVDNTSVYWVTDTAVMKVAICGGTPVPLASLASGMPRGLVVDPASAYFTVDDGRVMKVSLNGGTPVVLAPGQNNPSAIAVDSTHVYWTTGLICNPGCDGTISSLPLNNVDGGSPTAIASALAAMRIAIDSTSIYWTESNGYVRKMRLQGGAQETLYTPNNPAATSSAAFGFAIDSVNAYWTETVFPTSGGAYANLKQVPLTGGPSNIIVPGQGPVDIKTDGANLFWIGGRIVKSTPDGRVVTTLVPTVGSGGRIAVDATSVYWTDYTAGTVMRLTPK
jgi:hypothetical protein